MAKLLLFSLCLSNTTHNSRMDQGVFILGGNLGDKLGLIESATGLMVSYFGPVVLGSSIFESEPWGGKSEGNYLNQVLVFETSIPPEEALDIILGH
jgi:2-amino-4-hydroxy-6-hydroxymethyldihydropteridine diphosphokinase